MTDGKYDIGYGLNNLKKYRLQFGERSVIGGYELCNTMRIQYNFKARNLVECLSIRRKSWHELKEEYLAFVQSLQYSFVRTYSNSVIKPLHRMKLEDIKHMEERNDYQ